MGASCGQPTLADEEFVNEAAAREAATGGALDKLSAGVAPPTQGDIAEEVDKVTNRINEAEAAAKTVDGDVNAVEKGVQQVEQVVKVLVDEVGKVVGDAKHLAEEVKEAVQETAAEVVTAVKGPTAMTIEFEVGKGSVRKVDFQSQNLGFVSGLSSKGCCASADKAKVVVKSIEKHGQADKLGVQRGWVIQSVNGTEVTGLEQSRTVLAEQALKLAAA